MIKILLWAPMGAGLHYSGVGASAYRLYRDIYKHDVRVTLVHAHPDQVDGCYDEVIALGTVGKDKNAASLALFLARSYIWLRANSARFDIMHGLNAFEETITPASWAVKWGLPAIVKPASSGMGLVGGSLLSRCSGLMYLRRRRGRKVSKYVAISSDIEKDLLTAGIAASNIIRIPNGVDIIRFSPVPLLEKNILRQEFGIGAGERVILFVGSIESRKRPHMVLEALMELGATAPACRCYFVGPRRESDYNAKMDYLAQNVPAQVEVVFQSYSDEIEKYYRIADIFCLPSSNEGFPNSLLEAMASGLACISSPVSGSIDIIISGRNGYLAGDVSSIGALFVELCMNHQLCDQIALDARRVIVAEYSSEYISNRHIELFNELKKNEKHSSI